MSKVKLRNFYIRDIKHQVGASPIWPISANYSLGDYGYYSKRTGKFSVRGNIFEDLGVPREGVIIPQTEPVSQLFKIFNSSNTTRNNFSANIEASPQQGSLDLSFEGNKSYLFHLFKAEVSYLKLNDLVKQKLIQARENGQWDYRYRIIELVYTCPDTRFAFSLSKTAQITLMGDVENGQLAAKGTINYKMKSSSNMDGSIWIENAASTPFVHFGSFKRRELKFHDEKILIGTDWELFTDNTGSFDEDSESDETELLG